MQKSAIKFTTKKLTISLATILVAMITIPAYANIKVTEAAPWSSGNSPLAADWFELTNTGSSAIDISGWKFDDSSNSFASSVALNGISSINAGQSVIFVEGTLTTANNFITNWFGASAPAGFAIGYYSGAGIGLSTTSDAVNIFNASGVNQASVTFGASDNASPYQSFDNAAGLTGAISTLSTVGINGAFVAINSSTEIGSPGAVAAVPEPETYAMMLAGLGLVGFFSRKRQG